MRRRPAEPPVPGSPSTFIDSSSHIPVTYTDGLPLPQLLIFDLDHTLWPFWIDTNVIPPLRAKDKNTKAEDKFHEIFTFFTPVPSLLHASYGAGIPMALASRTETPDLAVQLLKLLHVPPPTVSQNSTSLPPTPTNPSFSSGPFPSQSHTNSTKSSSTTPPKRAYDFFAHTAIFPGDKRTHMAKLAKASGVGYNDMLFFDDELPNMNVETLGVTFWHIKEGISREDVDSGIWEWRRRRGYHDGPRGGSTNGEWEAR